MKNKKYIVLGILLLLAIANTTLVILKIWQPLDIKVADYAISKYSSLGDKVMNFFTFLGSTKWIIALTVLVFLFFLLREKKKNYAFTTAALIILSTLLNQALKYIIQRPRPTVMRADHFEGSYSYPSGHTMASVTLYGFFIYLILRSNISKGNKIFFSGLLTITIMLVMISRMYFGCHFLSDVLGGAIYSSIVLVIFMIVEDNKNILFEKKVKKQK